MSLQLDDIRCFLMVAETKNMTRASERAGMTQPAMSYAIRRLEREIGGEVFFRLKNGVELTRLGRDVLDKASALEHRWQEIQKIVDQGQSEVVGRYTLGAHNSVALYTFDRFLPGLLRKYPGLEFEVLNGLSREVTELVINWKCDFGIVVNPVKHPDLIIRELYKDTVGLYATPKADQTRILCEGKLVQTQSIVDKLRKSKIHFDSTMSCPSLEVVGKLALKGAGVAILPATIASQFKGLKRVRESFFFRDRICLIHRVEHHRDPAGQAVIKAIRKALTFDH